VACRATQQDRSNTAGPSLVDQDISELKTDVRELKTKLEGLDASIQLVISMLRDRP
jgi:hypothetical protein